MQLRDEEVKQDTKKRKARLSTPRALSLSRCRAKRYADRNAQGGRVRHVVPTSEVPHLWAHFAQSEARNGSCTVFFEGNTIYSYGRHSPIARHVANGAGKTAVLFTTKHYSVTTSAHCSNVRMSVSHLTVFDVPNVEAHGDHAHADNLKDYAQRITAALGKASAARSHADWHHKDALETREQAVRYARFFGLLYAGVLPTVPALGSKQLKALRVALAEQRKAERQKFLRQNAERITAWRAGEYVSLPFGLPNMLRMSKDGQEVETSRGVRFPASHAVRGLALVRSVRERGETWHTNGHTCHLGGYQIDSIDPHGNVKAGCHTVAWKEIAGIASALDTLPKPEQGPKLSPCGLPMDQIEDFASHVMTCRICGTTLNE